MAAAQVVNPSDGTNSTPHMGAWAPSALFDEMALEPFVNTNKQTYRVSRRRVSRTNHLQGGGGGTAVDKRHNNLLSTAARRRRKRRNEAYLEHDPYDDACPCCSARTRRDAYSGIHHLRGDVQCEVMRLSKPSATPTPDKNVCGAGDDNEGTLLRLQVLAFTSLGFSAIGIVTCVWLRGLM